MDAKVIKLKGDIDGDEQYYALKVTLFGTLSDQDRAEGKIGEVTLRIPEREYRLLAKTSDVLPGLMFETLKSRINEGNKQVSLLVTDGNVQEL